MAMSIKFTVTLTIFLLIGVGLAGLFMQPHVSYDAWNINQSSFPANASSEEKLTFLVGYAILAPSSHNSQPWKFNVSGDQIDIYADKSRWLQYADADKRELHISLGCALENLLVAADHFGYETNVTYLNEGDLAARVRLEQKSLAARVPAQDSRLIDAIVARKTNRNAYLDRPVAEADLQKLQDSANGFSKDQGIQFYLTSDPEIRNKFRDLETQADQTLYSDANYKSELGHWLGQGVLGPTGVQALAAQLAVVFLDVGPEETRKDAELVNSTPVLGFISTTENNSISQVKVGQAFERFWLEATALGISLQPMSQTLEVPETKAELTEILSTGIGGLGYSGYLQHAFRLGYAEPVEEHSPRRPLSEVMI
jgi:hypothetical protein